MDTQVGMDILYVDNPDETEPQNPFNFPDSNSGGGTKYFLPKNRKFFLMFQLFESLKKSIKKTVEK